MSNPEKLANSNSYEELFRSWSIGNLRVFPEGTTLSDLWEAMEFKRLLSLERMPLLEPTLRDHLKARGIL